MTVRIAASNPGDVVMGKVCRLLGVAGSDGAQERAVFAEVSGDGRQAVEEHTEDAGGEVVVSAQHIAQMRIARGVVDGAMNRGRTPLTSQARSNNLH
jgi:hypothetical protein